MVAEDMLQLSVCGSAPDVRSQAVQQYPLHQPRLVRLQQIQVRVTISSKSTATQGRRMLCFMPALYYRCLGALAEWEVLSQECRAEWRRVEPQLKREMAPIAAHAAWHMGSWDEMAG